MSDGDVLGVDLWARWVMKAHDGLYNAEMHNKRERERGIVLELAMVAFAGSPPAKK